MAKAEATVEELVGMIERGELRLPEMQRRYVWRSPRVRDLFDSLYRGYPSGAILLWETDEDVPLQDMAVGQQANPYKSTRLLLDGQQRLTSLSAVIRGEPLMVRGRKRPIELLFNLDHPEELAVVTEVNEEGGGDEDGEELIDDEADSTEDELQKRFNRMTFVVGTKKLAQLPQWVKVTDVFKSDSDASFLKRAGVTDLDDPNYVRYSKRLARLRAVRRYMYRMDVLERRLSYDEVTEIFVRVNSLGAKLRSSDLALAQITAKWRNSLKTFQAFQAECGQSGFDLDLGLHLKNLVAFATGQSRFLTVNNLGLDTLKESWKACCLGMEFALNFVKSNTGIDSPALLSSPFLLITVAYFGHKREYALSPDEEARLRYWVLLRRPGREPCCRGRRPLVARGHARRRGRPGAGPPRPRSGARNGLPARHLLGAVDDRGKESRSRPRRPGTSLCLHRRGGRAGEETRRSGDSGQRASGPGQHAMEYRASRAGDRRYVPGIGRGRTDPGSPARRRGQGQGFRPLRRGVPWPGRGDSRKLGRRVFRRGSRAGFRHHGAHACAFVARHARRRGALLRGSRRPVPWRRIGPESSRRSPR